MFVFTLLKEAKKKYDKETEKYCTVLEKHLSLSAKKKESHLHEVCVLTSLCVRNRTLGRKIITVDAGGGHDLHPRSPAP